MNEWAKKFSLTLGVEPLQIELKGVVSTGGFDELTARITPILALGLQAMGEREGLSAAEYFKSDLIHSCRLMPQWMVDPIAAAVSDGIDVAFQTLRDLKKPGDDQGAAGAVKGTPG